MLIARPNYTKEDLFVLAQQHVQQFCELNGLELPRIVINNTISNYGYYKYDDDNGHIVLNFKQCNNPVFNPTTGRLQSFPGNKTDRTIAGVLCHEVGHYVDFTTRTSINLAMQFRTLYGVENTITSYDVMDIERVAESFRLFLLNPTLLQVGRPKTFALLAKYFKPVHNWPWKLLFHYVDKKHLYYNWCEKWIEKSCVIDKQQMCMKQLYEKYNSRVRYINLNEPE